MSYVRTMKSKSWWWCLGFLLFVANSAIVGMCFYKSPIVWDGLFNLFGAIYIATLLFRRGDTREEKLAALLRYREELTRQPASQEVYATIDTIDILAENLRRRREE